MRSGRLRTRITIENQAIEGDSSGDPEVTWTAAATVWGDVRPTRGGESVDGLQLVAAVSFAVVVRRPRPGVSIDATSRLILPDGRILYVDSVFDPDLRGSRLEITCSNRPPVGS